MEYLAPGHGGLFTRFTLSAATASLIERELTRTGMCEIELSSTVTDKEGTEVAKLTSTYRIRRRS
jgi:hypothetical protein